MVRSDIDFLQREKGEDGCRSRGYKTWSCIM